jgi:hypothetical protein
MSRVNLASLYVAATLLACGCEKKSSAPSTAKAPAAKQSERTLEFAGRTWAYVGPTRDTGDVWRPSMAAVLYTCDDPGLRLIEHIPREGGGEGVFSRMLHVQANVGGRWVNHGPKANWTLRGTWGESHNSYGKTNGVQREWHPNGQLWIEREIVNDKYHGRARGWHENGQLEHDATYVNDVEIEGRNWDENGEPL